MVSIKDVPDMNSAPKESANGLAIVREIRYKNGDVIMGRQTKPRLIDRDGFPAISWEVREQGPSGLRTSYTWWLEGCTGQGGPLPAGTVTAVTVKGSRQSGTFHVIAPAHAVIIEGLPPLS